MTALIIILSIYAGLWLWSSWEYRQRAKHDHKCQCHNGKCAEHD